MLDKYRYSWYNKSVKDIVFFAAVVELADTRDLKSRGSNPVPVQVRSAAPNVSNLNSIKCYFYNGLFVAVVKLERRERHG